VTPGNVVELVEPMMVELPEPSTAMMLAMSSPLPPR
jgi:hypothetical protein